ncbi:succinoglycan biosynthesis protein [Thioclava sp. F42-5]|uniref:thermonuclease family protein n=1 Tax=Thioclava sp. F42-5 TaxID=1973005 RepID=UPI000B540F8C|nr:thermonuclease family protein [Thioclava sp. F42-5]OWY08899.1 succinoglycan biosynthesis protein [Thioclava sp. F42-5]
MPLRFALSLIIAAALCEPLQAQTISGTASVIDGDTIDIHGERIRLQAIDAIESRQRCRLPSGKLWNCGKDAAFALADKIGRAPVACKVSGIDRYGRYVAVCSQHGEDLNSWLVRNGWAVAYRRYGRDYVQDEDVARKLRAGIWASEFLMPWDWRRKN